MAERIGDFLVRTGALQPPQVEAVMAAQKAGDKRTFGEIAIGLGLCRQGGGGRVQAELTPLETHTPIMNERQLSK